jgi:pimeloyl-ACP methyl ester carboxylesterase
MKKLLLLYLFVFGLTVCGQAQHLKVQVSGSGPKVILIPGLASSGEVWEDAVSQLAMTHECHVLTLPGFAENPAADLSAGFLSTMEGLVTDYIQKQNESVILIGHSLGGFLSLGLSKSNPQLVKKIIIVDSYPFYSAAMNPAATEEGMKSMAQQMKEMMISVDGEQYKAQQEAASVMMTNNSEKAPLIVEWSVESDRNTISQAMYELMTTDYRNELDQVNIPMLVLGAWYAGKDYGMTEASVRETFETQYRRAPNVRIEMAPTAHHFIMWDNPAWFMQQVNAFL